MDWLSVMSPMEVDDGSAYYAVLTTRGRSSTRSEEATIRQILTYADSNIRRILTYAEYELQRIVDLRTRYKKFEYLIEYKGYPVARDYEWRSECELKETAPTMLKEFTDLFDSKSEMGW